MKQIIIPLFFLFLLWPVFQACQREEEAEEVTYSDSLYILKSYKVERHPTVLRNGFGMDMYHNGDASSDTSYLRSDTSSFPYDLKFFNEFAYAYTSTGDLTNSGYPVIFMYTDTLDDNKSVKATMIGQGIERFEALTFDSIPKYTGSLKADPYIDLSKYRTEVHTSSVDGVIMFRDSIDDLYLSLVIGNKFRPDVGGYMVGIDADDADQIYSQPVFLVRTREGQYAKFMVTRFKGVGADTQRCTLQWEDLRK